MMRLSFVKQVKQENSSLKVYLPRDVVLALKLKEGDFIKVTVEKVEVEEDE